MSTYFKKGVIGFEKLHPILNKCFGRIEAYYKQCGKDCKITSVMEGNHKAGSLHYLGRAIDFTSLNEETKTIRGVINKYCDYYGIPRQDFDLINYPHLRIFHLEYDVK